MKNGMTAGGVADELEELKNGHIVENDPFYNKLIDYVTSILRRVASGELAEVVHAQWIELPFGRHKCSNCKHLCAFDGDGTDYISPHCPVCGALMDGKDDSHAKENT